MFAAVAILVGTIVSMTTTGMVAAQTVSSSNNDNINTNNCQEINPVGLNVDGATAAATSDSETGATDDADEPGDTDVNDEEDTDTGNEDAGEGMTQLASEVRPHIEGACMALQNNDIQGALVHLDLALSMLATNTTTSVGSGAATNSTIVGASETGSGEGTTTAGGLTASGNEGPGGITAYGGGGRTTTASQLKLNINNNNNR